MELTEKYLNGQTSTEEEQRLRERLESQASLTAEQHALLTILKAAPIKAEEWWLQEDESDLYDRLLAERQSVVSRHPWSWMGIAAAMVIALGIGLALNKENENAGAVAYIYGKRVTNQTEVLGMMEDTMQGLLANSSADKAEQQLADIFGH